MFELSNFGRELGYGRSGIVITIDFMRGFTEPDRAFGLDLSRQLESTNRIIRAARKKRIPVMHVSVAYEDEDYFDAGLWVMKQRGAEYLRSCSEETDFDPRLDVKSIDYFLKKKYASAFFGTDLFSRLNAAGCDTAILTGVSTSGCVRATAVDAIQYGFRPLIVEEAVGDRDQAAHDQALKDIAAKYGDVLSLAHVLTIIDSVGE